MPSRIFETSNMGNRRSNETPVKLQVINLKHFNNYFYASYVNNFMEYCLRNKQSGFLNIVFEFQCCVVRKCMFSWFKRNYTNINRLIKIVITIYSNICVYNKEEEENNDSIWNFVKKYILHYYVQI